MSKLAHSAAAFARRVKMGSARLWILVEGKSNDAVFYDQVAATVMKSDEYEIRAVEQITLDEKSAGGKRFSLRLFDYWREQGVLRQESRSGIRSIALAVDRDFDDFGLQRIVHPHVVYTKAADVEGEVLCHVDIRAVTAATYSVPGAVLPGEIQSDGVSTLNAFGELWFDWLRLRACACRFDTLPGVRLGDKSQVNKGAYGELDEDALRKFSEQLENSESYDASKIDAVNADLSSIRARGKLHLLVKGKWLEGYVWHLVRKVDFPHPANVKADTLTRVAIGSLDFSGSWADHYRKRFLATLESGREAA